jgi:hypothetical protein
MTVKMSWLVEEWGDLRKPHYYNEHLLGQTAIVCLEHVEREISSREMWQWKAGEERGHLKHNRYYVSGRLDQYT